MLDTETTRPRPLSPGVPREGTLTGALLGGRYRLGRLIGAGGMADVYEASDERLLTRVAVKVLRAERSFADLGARMLQEARVLAALTHPNLTRVQDVAEHEGSVYMVMELLRGRTLGVLVTEAGGALFWSRALARLLPVMAALHVAHEAGLIHRDVKPGNIIIVPEGAGERPVLIDFGIAKAEAHRRALDGPATTELGLILGTPRYASPEQIAGEALDRRSDVYSMGVTLFRVITGTFPAPGQIVERAPPALALAVERALSVDPARRFATMQEFAEALAPLLIQAPGARARVPRAALSGLALAGLAAGAWASSPPGASGACSASPTDLELEVECPTPLEVSPPPTESTPRPTSADERAPRVRSPRRPSPASAVPPALVPVVRTEAPMVAPAVVPDVAAARRSLAAALQRCYGELKSLVTVSVSVAATFDARGAAEEVEIRDAALETLAPCVRRALGPGDATWASVAVEDVFLLGASHPRSRP